MKPVDGEADLALQKILRAAFEPWKERERSALTRFIFSLLYRQPEVVRKLKEHIRDLHLASIEGCVSTMSNGGNRGIRQHSRSTWQVSGRNGSIGPQ